MLDKIINLHSIAIVLLTIVCFTATSLECKSKTQKVLGLVMALLYIPILFFLIKVY
ncbi:hypothetical protein [Gottschalkia purinilytica]|uniref:hypothetical protein n=1 Tax=Gottschalkia purinilytica TaxID=1503 RepID=UPI0012FF4075|nr:hypothetical protein [Gottschalkia purinilytica]